MAVVKKSACKAVFDYKQRRKTRPYAKPGILRSGFERGAVYVEAAAVVESIITFRRVERLHDPVKSIGSVKKTGGRNDQQRGKQYDGFFTVPRNIKSGGTHNKKGKSKRYLRDARAGQYNAQHKGDQKKKVIRNLTSFGDQIKIYSRRNESQGERRVIIRIVECVTDSGERDAVSLRVKIVSERKNYINLNERK